MADYSPNEKDRIVSEMVANILAETGTEASSRAAENICRSWLDFAIQICNRTDIPDAMTAIVKDISMAAYNRRGDEGAKSSSVGGQSMTYDDLHITMRQRLIDAGLRIFKL